ncbi:DUF7344 domain-containing protein [Natrarchaeobius chitinivorans]|uniref:DUF7344 domain-containing protein n=1 Tax=Natrarchaeobius chitinivorans TaxID=1679083 RepID=A0A3N6MLV3_NATCH|nr:hypothetical protein [Natrarchaeobius chitinivorans]RQG97011.1 hypothetical protein EA473_02715 [Natrarchaeobius chitinivorans]
MNTTAPTDRSTRSRDAAFRSLADDHRRTLLAIVHDRSPDGIEKTELSVEFAAVTNDKPPGSVTDDERQRALVDCRHRQLPALIDAGLLEIDGDERVVTTDHWFFGTPQIEAVLVGHTDESDDVLSTIFGVIADSRRRTLLSVLEDWNRSVSVETLARSVAAREAETTVHAVSAKRVDRVQADLVHVHLPLLDDAGLLEYDHAENHISYDGHPILAVDRLTDESADTDGDDESTPLAAAVSGRGNA